MNATKSPRNVKPARPVAGVCKWLRRLDWHGVGVLLINGKPYTVETLLGSDQVLAGYRLTKDDQTTYDIDTTGTDWQCSCPDATYRERECKHCKGLRAALAAIGK
jgi:hypothetical protein